MTRDLFTDVNLSQIDFGSNSGELSLQFLNMSDGSPIGTLSCEGVVTFAYHDYADSGLPVYVGRVFVEEISGQEALNVIGTFGYQVEQHSELLRRMSLYHVRIEGGLMVHIVCQRVSLDTAIQSEE